MDWHERFHTRFRRWSDHLGSVINHCKDHAEDIHESTGPRDERARSDGASVKPQSSNEIKNMDLVGRGSRAVEDRAGSEEQSQKIV